MTGLTWVSGGAPADGEDLAQVFILLRKALLQPLQLSKALAALVLHGAHVLDEVELGLGGVVAQDAVVIAALPLHAALMLLQVLRGQRRETLPWSGTQGTPGHGPLLHCLGRSERCVNGGTGWDTMAVDKAPYTGYFHFPPMSSPLEALQGINNMLIYIYTHIHTHLSPPHGPSPVAFHEAC